MACCFDCILQSGGGSGLSAQIGALQQSWRANPPADFARTELWEGAVAVRYAHLAATAINMRTGGGKCYSRDSPLRKQDPRRGAHFLSSPASRGSFS